MLIVIILIITKQIIRSYKSQSVIMYYIPGMLISP